MSPERYVKILIYDLDKIIEVITSEAQRNEAILIRIPERNAKAVMAWAEKVWMSQSRAVRLVDILVWLGDIGIIHFDYYLFQHEQRDHADEYPKITIHDIQHYITMKLSAHDVGIDDDLTDILRI